MPKAAKGGTVECRPLGRPMLGRLIPLLVLGACAVSNEVAAQAWVVRPSVRLQQTYDDNFRLSVSDPDEVFTTRGSAEAKVSRLTEDMESSGVFRLDATRYSGDTDGLSDKNNQLANFSTLYRPDQLNSWSISGTLKRDTLLRTVEIIVDPEDVEIEPDDDIDDALVRRNVRRTRLILRPSWQRKISERMEIDLGYRFNDVTFDDEGGTGLAEFTEHTVKGELFLRVTEKDRLSTSLATRQFRVPDEDREDVSYALLTGIIHQFSETETGSFRLGLRRTQFEAGSERSDDDGFVMRVDGVKRTGEITFSGKFERSLAPSGSGEQVEKSELAFNASKRLSELTRFTLRTRLFETETLRVDDLDVTRRYLQFEPRLTWRLSREWSVDGYYRFRKRKIDGDPESADSNTVFVSFRFSQPTPLN